MPGQEGEGGLRRFKGALEREDGMTMGHLKENSKGVFSGFGSFFGGVPDTDAETLSQAARCGVLPVQALPQAACGPHCLPMRQAVWSRVAVTGGASRAWAPCVAGCDPAVSLASEPHCAAAGCFLIWTRVVHAAAHGIAPVQRSAAQGLG